MNGEEFVGFLRNKVFRQTEQENALYTDHKHAILYENAWM